MDDDKVGLVIMGEFVSKVLTEYAPMDLVKYNDAVDNLITSVTIEAKKRGVLFW